MNRKIIWKFNIIDLILLAILTLSVLGLVYKATLGNDKSETQTFTINYTCKAYDADLLSSLNSGDSCLDGDTGTELGKLSNVEMDSINQTAMFSTIVEGSKSEHGITIKKTPYLKGKRLNLIVGDCVFEVYIKEIK
ncbi:MAG: hypothetical protein RSB38_01035 [Oscillospiraceae bacterium]